MASAKPDGGWLRYKDVNKENEALRARIREVEDENQELQAQSLIQNRTILGMRNELALMRIQLNEMAVTSALLTERVRQMMQESRGGSQMGSESSGGQITAPPLMAPPPPPPPPLSPTFIRITPRQVGAGEALMTRLGLSMPSPPRHRIKRDIRQPMRRASRSPAERMEPIEVVPPQSSGTKSKNANGFRVPQLQGPFLYSQDCNDSGSDSSDSEEGPQTPQRKTCEDSAGLFQRAIIHSFNFPTSQLFIPMSWERRDKESHALPSTSRMENDFAFVEREAGKRSKVSECVQYTFPNAHEGIHQSGVRSVMTAVGQSVRAAKPCEDGEANGKKGEGSGTAPSEEESAPGFESESQSSTDDETRKESEIEPSRRRLDVEQDGFQADESSNCITSTENSLERVAISEADMEKN